MLLETGRALMFQDEGVEVDPRLWGEAVLTANYLRNRLPSHVLGWKTPYEVFYSRPARIDHLCVWGSKCVVHIPKDMPPKRSKLQVSGRYGMFVGYSDEKR